MKLLELAIEAVLFSARWRMVPISLGLVVILGAISVKFNEELIVTLPNILHMEERDWVIFVLSLVDLALLANLVVMIIFVGYKKFVSKLHTAPADGVVPMTAAPFAICWRESTSGIRSGLIDRELLDNSTQACLIVVESLRGPGRSPRIG